MMMLLFLLILTDVREVSGTYPLCLYRFVNPVYPTFILPPAQPRSPGDAHLNPGNSIRLLDWIPLSHGCTSGKFYYLTSSGTFSSVYTDSNGKLSSIENQFYVKNVDQLMIRTIQSNNANLASFLAGKVLKLELTCNNGLFSCIYFTVGLSTTTTPVTTMTTTPITTTRITTTPLTTTSLLTTTPITTTPITTTPITTTPITTTTTTPITTTPITTTPITTTSPLTTTTPISTTPITTAPITTTPITTTTTESTTTTNPTPEPSCENGIKDQDETDIDCGGKICTQRCGPTQTCGDNSDCQPGIGCAESVECPDPEIECPIVVKRCTSCVGGGDDGNGCFSKDENVTMADFRSKPIGDVRTGDFVWTMTDDGPRMQLSEVMMVSHIAPNDTNVFYTVETSTGHRLSLTGTHYIRVHGFGYIQGNKLSINHSIYVMMNDRTMRLARIRSIKQELKTGLYNLFTLHGSYFVNGIAASSYINISHFSHEETHSIVAPLRWGYTISKPFKRFQGIYPVETTVRQWLIKVLKKNFDALVFLHHARAIVSAMVVLLLGIGCLTIVHRVVNKQPFHDVLFIQKKLQ